MIEKTLKTTHGKILIRIPSQLNEITLEQLMAMQERPGLTDLEAISILSGISMDDLNTIKHADDLQQFNDHIFSLAHQIKYLYNSDSIPQKVTFGYNGTKVTVNVIKNLSVEPAGAFMAAREIIADEIARHIELHGEENWQQSFNPSLKASGQVLAHYFYCRVTGNRYNEYQADEFYKHIYLLPITDALPIAKYFFLSYPRLFGKKISFWHRVQLLWKKRLELKPLNPLNILTP